MRLTGYGKREWIIILVAGAVLAAGAGVMRWWWAVGSVIAVVLALLSFFRDPHRKIPSQKNVMVSPADGKVSSIHQVEHFEPFGEPATCIRVFLSVLNVHVNRSPCHGYVETITPKPGEYLNALNPRSAEVNESNLIVLTHPARRSPVAAVRQVSGLIARTIVCGTAVGQIVQRGQRIGMIKFGSTAELYVPQSLQPQVQVKQGQTVHGGSTVLVHYVPHAHAGEPAGSE